jgi:hypothetical protein
MKHQKTKVFWFFFSKKNSAFFFEKKKQKTFVFCSFAARIYS